MRLQRIFRTLKCLVPKLTTRNVNLVTDKANWIFDWIGYYIARHLKEQHGIVVYANNAIQDLKNQIIHYIDRHTYLNGTFRAVHPSNQIFLSWFHGDPADPRPNMQCLFSVLPEVAERIQKIIVSCQISRRILIEFGISENKLVTIPLGIDLARFYPSTPDTRLSLRIRLGIPNKAICIGSFQKDGVGWGDGIEPKLEKGPDIFLRVIARLYAKYDNLFVLLTGPARGYVKQGLEKIGVPYIHYFLSNYHDIVNYYHALDLYIITSRCEGGPSALLESWATGIPLISTRVGMPADLIEHGSNGMITAIEDIEHLTQYTMAMIEDVSLHERCRCQAIEDVKQYDWQLIAEQYYRKLYHPFLE